jgi:hypothetical protein
VQLRSPIGGFVRDELAMAGTTKSASLELRLDERGRVAGALPVPQSE